MSEPCSKCGSLVPYIACDECYKVADLSEDAWWWRILIGLLVLSCLVALLGVAGALA